MMMRASFVCEKFSLKLQQKMFSSSVALATTYAAVKLVKDRIIINTPNHESTTAAQEQDPYSRRNQVYTSNRLIEPELATNRRTFHQSGVVMSSRL
jgi:hypothetical protein